MAAISVRILLATLLVAIPWTCESASAGEMVAWGFNKNIFLRYSWQPGKAPNTGQCDVSTGDDFVAVTAGAYHSLALKSDGSIVAWGWNMYGQCEVAEGTDFVALAAGYYHSLALKADGSIAAWGRGEYGQCNPQLVDEDNVVRHIVVPAIGKYVAIAAGYWHSLAVRSDGSIVAWGANYNGQCDVPRGEDFVAVAAGVDHSLALKSDGSIVAWGGNRDGVGQVPSGHDFIAIAAGENHNLALRSDGSVAAWGGNTYGQCDVPARKDFVAIAAGYNHSVGLRSDGSVTAWGRNDHSQCTVPEKIARCAAIAGGGYHTVALKADAARGGPLKLAPTTGRLALLSEPQQMALFISGRNDYGRYRIPAAVVSKKGTILVFCEARKIANGDQGNIDIALRRSFDNGRTWTKMEIVHDEGEDAKITVANPTPVVDRDTGTIWLFFTRNSQNVLVTHSDDDGNTWATPTNLTSTLKESDQRNFYTGPGHGIQLRFGPKKGRLMVTAYAAANDGWHSFVIYSDDHGKTWNAGGRTVQGNEGSECLVVEMVSGDLYMDLRSNKQGTRNSTWSRDAGETWEPMQPVKELVEPHSQGSIVGYPDRENPGKIRVVQANPVGPSRANLTVRLSNDHCKTWTAGKLLHAGPAAYSDLTVLPNGDIACFYEGGEKWRYAEIVFARFPLQWLTNGQDRPAPK